MSGYEVRVPPWPQFSRPSLDVLSDGKIWRTGDLKTEVMDRVGLNDEQRADTLNSGQGRADNRVGWALSFLTRAQAVRKIKNGESQITDFGHQMLREHPEEITEADLKAVPAFQNYVPQTRKSLQADDSDDLPTYWFVGAVFGIDGGEAFDHTPEFRAAGHWRAEVPHNYADQIKKMKIGDRIAIKSAFTRKHGLPFEINGKVASVMAIKAIGTITSNPGDGNGVEVAWEPEDVVPEQDWYFWTNRNTVWMVRPSTWKSQALVKFAFDGADQDYGRFLTDPYWVKKYFDGAAPDPVDEEVEQIEEEALTGDPSYAVADIVADGCFIPEVELAGYLSSLKRKKNLILQGPPGTGKTWLAKRLAYAMIGHKDRSLIHAVQFHPTVSYEDFVRGWRPSGNGTLKLSDGKFLEVIEAAVNEPDNNHVLVIEEINRANLAQVMGELLTLLEADKRKPSEALNLSYSRSGEDPVFIPENLYLIGTMNLADRSLAIVDFALRRRFAFADLTPQFNAAWQQWVSTRSDVDSGVLTALAGRLEALNQKIAGDRALGEQYSIGHSFFTPNGETSIEDPAAWIGDVVDQEIRPLLAEYWFDDPERVSAEVTALIGPS